MNENIPTSDNNPGDLKDPTTGGFQKFSTPIDGQAALYNQLETYMSGKNSWGINGNSSLVDFAKTYAPSSDDNNPIQYAANLANQIGVSPDAPIGSLQPNIDKFAKAVANNEGYEGPWAGQSGNEQQPLATPNHTSSMPDWMTYGLGGLGAIAGLAGLNIIPGVGEAADAAAIGEAGADVAGTAAGAAADASESGGLISKALNLGKNALVGEGTSAIINKALGGQQAPASTPAQPQTDPATSALYKGQQEALSSTMTGRVMSTTPEGQMGMAANSLYGMVPDIETNDKGQLSYNSAGAIEQNKNAVGDIHNGLMGYLDAEGQTGSVDEAEQAAIENMKRNTPVHEQADAARHIQSTMDSWRQQADENGNLSLGQFARMKSETGGAAGDWRKTPVSAHRQALKAVSMGARGTIEAHTKNKDLFNKAMAEEQKLINGRKVLSKLHGKVAHRKRGLVRSAAYKLADFAGIALGDKIGGPFGAVVGAFIGETATKALDKKLGRVALDVPAVKKALEAVGQKSPHMEKVLRQETEKILGKRIEDAMNELQAQRRQSEMSEKRTAYQGRKKDVMNPQHRTPEKEKYEPHGILSTIKMGPKAKRKEERMYAHLPTIQ